MGKFKHTGGTSKHMAASHRWWHPNTQVVSKHMVASKSAYGHLTKHCVYVQGACRCHHLLCLTKLCCVCTHHPNIWGHPIILVFPLNSLTLAKIGSHHLHKKKLHSFILTQLVVAILKPCWIQTLLVSDTIFSQIHSKTLFHD